MTVDEFLEFVVGNVDQHEMSFGIRIETIHDNAMVTEARVEKEAGVVVLTAKCGHELQDMGVLPR